MIYIYVVLYLLSVVYFTLVNAIYKIIYIPHTHTVSLLYTVIMMLDNIIYLLSYMRCSLAKL